MPFRTELHWIDVNPHLASGAKRPPEFFLERAQLPQGNSALAHGATHVGTFLALLTPPGLEPAQWSLVRDGQYVRVPIYGFEVPLGTGTVILAAGFELATRFVDALRKYTPAEIEVLHLVLHHETHSRPDNGVCLYAGVAVQLKD